MMRCCVSEKQYFQPMGRLWLYERVIQTQEGRHANCDQDNISFHKNGNWVYMAIKGLYTNMLINTICFLSISDCILSLIS